MKNFVKKIEKKVIQDSKRILYYFGFLCLYPHSKYCTMGRRGGGEGIMQVVYKKDIVTLACLAGWGSVEE